MWCLENNQSNTREKWRQLVTGENLKSLQPTHSLWIKEIIQEGTPTKWKKEKGAKKEDDL